MGTFGVLDRLGVRADGAESWLLSFFGASVDVAKEFDGRRVKMPRSGEVPSIDATAVAVSSIDKSASPVEPIPFVSGTAHAPPIESATKPGQHQITKAGAIIQPADIKSSAIKPSTLVPASPSEQSLETDLENLIVSDINTAASSTLSKPAVMNLEDDLDALLVGASSLPSQSSKKLPTTKTAATPATSNSTSKKPEDWLDDLLS